MVKYGISLMDPKAIYLDKVCLRYQPKSILPVFQDELKFNKTKNIFNFNNKKLFEVFLKKTILSNKRKKKKKHTSINEIFLN